MLLDPARELADELGRDAQEVREDLEHIRWLLVDKKRIINEFFVKGEGWLYDPLEDWQEGIADRCWDTRNNCEVLARGHTKTTLGGRIIPAIDAIFDLESYSLVMSLTQDNYQSNLDAIYHICTSPEFGELQWLMAYFHGHGVVQRAGHVLTFPNGNVIEFRSILSESRGVNKVEAKGRPSKVTLDDVIPTGAIESPTMRSKILTRYLAMIRPIGAAGSKITVVGTVMHKEDLVNQIRTGVIKGYQVTPREHQQAYNEATKEVLFKKRHTYTDLMQVKADEYDSTGMAHLWRREYLNDPTEADTHPLGQYTIEPYQCNRIVPSSMYRVVAIDHAHGAGGDNFAVAEVGQDKDGEAYILEGLYNNTWDLEHRIANTIAMLRQRQPDELVIEDNVESRSFIEVLLKEMAKQGLYCNVHRPSPSERGSKLTHITSWIQPRLSAGTLRAAEGSKMHKVFVSECQGFDATKKDNIDDLLDCVANALKRLQIPSKDLALFKKTGIRYLDDLNSDLARAGKRKPKKGKW